MAVLRSPALPLGPTELRTGIEVRVTSARGQQYGGARSAAVVGGLLLAAGTLTAGVTVAADASGTSAAKNVRLTLGYACQFPSGTERLGVTIAATFPAAAVAGGRIQPTGVVLTVQLPPATIAALRQQGAATVSFHCVSIGSGKHSGRRRMTQWQGRTASRSAATGNWQRLARRGRPGHAGDRHWKTNRYVRRGGPDPGTATRQRSGQPEP